MSDTENPKFENHFVWMGGITPYTIRQLILSKSEALIEIIEQEAKGGNWKAADALLRYAMPQAPVTYHFDMPNGDSDVLDKIGAVLNAISAGKLPPTDGARLLDAIGRIEQVDSMRRIEKQIEEMKNESIESDTITALDAAIKELCQLRDNGAGGN